MIPGTSTKVISPKIRKGNDDTLPFSLFCDVANDETGEESNSWISFERHALLELVIELSLSLSLSLFFCSC